MPAPNVKGMNAPSLNSASLERTTVKDSYNTNLLDQVDLTKVVVTG